MAERRARRLRFVGSSSLAESGDSGVCSGGAGEARRDWAALLKKVCTVGRRTTAGFGAVEATVRADITAVNLSAVRRGAGLDDSRATGKGRVSGVLVRRRGAPCRSFDGER